MSAGSQSANENRIERLTGVPVDEIEREYGSTHSYRHGSMCSRCKSRVGPDEMVPCHDSDGPKTLTCPNCGVDLVNLRS